MRACTCGGWGGGLEGGGGGGGCIMDPSGPQPIPYPTKINSCAWLLRITRSYAFHLTPERSVHIYRLCRVTLWYEFIFVNLKGKLRNQVARLRLGEASGQRHSVPCVFRFIQDTHISILFLQRVNANHNWYHFIALNDDVIKWKHFPRYWPLGGESTGQRLSPLTKASGAGLWCFLWSPPNGWGSNWNGGDLRRHRSHDDVRLMVYRHITA